MQGPMTASQKDAEGSSNGIHTLDDVRLGKSKYVTLASASSMKGRYYCIGTVTYTSPPGNGGDGKTHTLSNVVGYVHDTGCAFNGTCSCAFVRQFCDGKARTDKMDIAVGNFNGYSAEFAMNYITKNPNRAPKDWTQIAGIPRQSGDAASALAPCGGQPKEEGTPVSAQHIPPMSLAPQNPLQGMQSPGQSPGQSYQEPQSSPTGGSTGGSSGGGAVGNGSQVYTGAPAYADPGYYGAPLPQAPVPTQGTPSSTMLSSLFQQSSATSGIRVVQSTAQALIDLFSTPQSAGSRPVVQQQSPAPAALYDTSNVSLMAVSQYDDVAQMQANSAEVVGAGTIPRPNNPVSYSATAPQENTFQQQTIVQSEQALSPQTTQTFLSIIASFRTLFESMMRMFTRQ